MPEDQDPTVDIGRDQRQDRADREPGQPARKVPKQVGKYFIKSLVATGGMGSVYKAVQDQPRRTVALKLMKTGLQSRSALRRFEYESQVLARLRHPCIAEVFEAGTHETPDGGVPYFAMEYIPNARRITDYAREKSLSTPERLKLFLDVCEAVHHGHTKGVIHRDLKPDNILVDSHGRVKLIDFGVARATDSDMVAATLQTEIGQLVGTVQYMSPEQVEADPDDLDIRSDVYSLGVVLYELLCQRLPYDVGQTNVYDVTRIIREQEAIGLSTVDASLKGDVETIVLKTLEKDRGRRYQSAENLASDIRRYLNTEPITARPPSVAYQLQTFARRNKSLVAGVSAVFLALLIGFISSTLLWIDAVDARNTARKRQAEAETARHNESAQRALAEQAQESALTEAERARKQAAAAEAVSEFLLEDVISAADPETQPNRDITLRQVIDEASARIGDQFADTPLIEATIMVRLGQIYRNLGERITAQQMLQRAHELRRESLGESHLATLEAMEHLALATFRKDPKAAWKMLQDVLEARKRILGESHADTLGTKSLLLIYENVGQYLQGKTNPAVWLKSEEKALELLAESRRELGEDHKITLRLLAQLGWIYGQQGREVELLETSEKALESRRRTLGEKHPMTIDVQQRLADAYRDHGRYDEAEILYRQVLSLQREVLGESHPSTVDTLEEFADSYALQQRLKDAVPLLVEAVEANWRAGRVDSKPESKLGVTYAWMSDVESYTTLCQQVLARHKRTDDLLVAYFSAMTFLLSPHQDHSATLPIAVSVVERAEILNKEQPDRGMSQHIAGALGLAAYRTTKFHDAVRYLNIARESEDPAVKALALAHLAMTKIRMGDSEEVVPLLEQSAAVIETMDSSDNTWQSILACRLALREARELVASQTLDQ